MSEPMMTVREYARKYTTLRNRTYLASISRTAAALCRKEGITPGKSETTASEWGPSNVYPESILRRAFNLKITGRES